MEVYGKSAAEKKQAVAKLKAGADGIELHLPSEELPDVEFLVEHKVRAIHMPLKRFNDYAIETKCGRDILNKVADLAESVAVATNRNVIIVVHCGCSKEVLEREGLLEEVRNALVKCVEVHEHVEIGLENVVPFDRIEKTIQCLRQGIPRDTVSVAKYCNHDRIGTTLDICHACMTGNFYRALSLCYFDSWVPESTMFIDLVDYFRENHSVIKLIHMAWYKYDGYGDGHGTPITDAEIMQRIMAQYHFFGYKCPITLEVRENDYYATPNFKATLKTLKENEWYKKDYSR